MANKKLLYLFAWYITWTIIGSLYSNKKGDDVRKDMEESKKMWEYEDKKVLLDHIVDTHKKFFTEVTKEPNVKKATEFVSGYKETLGNFFDTSKSEIITLLKEHKTLWEEDIQAIATKLQWFVKSKFDAWMNQVKKYTQSASESVQQAKQAPSSWIKTRKTSSVKSSHLKKKPTKSPASKPSSKVVSK
jgi:hypothetical protein